MLPGAIVVTARLDEYPRDGMITKKSLLETQQGGRACSLRVRTKFEQGTLDDLKEKEAKRTANVVGKSHAL